MEKESFYSLKQMASRRPSECLFFSIIGTKSYALLRDLLLPDKPRDKSLEALMEVLKSHFEPAPSVIAERFKFYRRDQKTGESVEEFKAELKKLSTHCAFGTHLEEALRDRFVCGLQNSVALKRLLTEKTLTFASAVEIASNIQQVDKQALVMMNPVTDSNIQKVSRQVECYRCGKGKHNPSLCKFKEVLVIVVAREAISKQYVNPGKPTHSHTLGVHLTKQSTVQEEPNG